MASWSTRRKYGSFIIFIAAAVVLIGLPSFFVFYKAPTCFDNKQNGGETGIDCGGSCSKLCAADFSAPRVLWSYSVKVVPGIYNTLAYVQNPNPSVYASGLAYLFKLFDAQGLLVAERTGSALVPVGQKFAIFEGGIDTGKRVPARTTFEFTGLPDWKQGRMLTQLHTLDVAIDQSAQPRATATVRNDSPDQSVSNIDAFIILYDKNDNRVSFSKTVIDSIGPGETQTLNFTWPEAFSTDIVRKEILFVPRS